MDEREKDRRWMVGFACGMAEVQDIVRRAIAPAPIPRCHCGRPVGAGNEIRDQVGGIIIACRSCAGPAPLRGVDEKGCNCWVRDRPAEERFSIRYGAHDVQCPMWAPSLDPVDAANDAELRLRLDRP